MQQHCYCISTKKSIRLFYKEVGAIPDTFETVLRHFLGEVRMTFSCFVKILKSFVDVKMSKGRFVIELLDESLEDVEKADEKFVMAKNGCLSYNPIGHESTANKLFNGSRQISRENFKIIGRHYERNKFIAFIDKRLMKNDDNYRILALKLNECGVKCDEENVVETCADIFEEIIANSDGKYKKRSEISPVTDSDQSEFKGFVHSILEKMVEEKDWPFRSPRYKIFKDKPYELLQEGMTESFDIVIENYNSDNPTPSMTLLIRCQKSREPVTKDKLVLFVNKVRQVSGCCKALFVTNSSIEDSAFQYAVRFGVAVLRIFDEEKRCWLAPRIMDERLTYIEVEKCEREIQKALFQENYKITNNFAVGYYEGYYGDLSSFFNKIFTDTEYSRVGNVDLLANGCTGANETKLRYLCAEDLRRTANAVRYDIYGNKGDEIKNVESAILIQYINHRFGFNVEFPREEPVFTFPQKVRGLVDYENRKILIYGIDDVDLHLLKFSIAHEISHLVLHCRLLEHSKSNFVYFYEATKESERMESQANRLASYILLNDALFQMEFKKLAFQHDLHPRKGYYLYLDRQECNVNQFLQISGSLASIFDVSREQIKYRLLELCWLRIAGDVSFYVA